MKAGKCKSRNVMKVKYEQLQYCNKFTCIETLNYRPYIIFSYSILELIFRRLVFCKRYIILLRLVSTNLLFGCTINNYINLKTTLGSKTTAFWIHRRVVRSKCPFKKCALPSSLERWVCTSETSVQLYDTTRLHISEACYLYARDRENLKFQNTCHGSEYILVLPSQWSQFHCQRVNIYHSLYAEYL